MNNETVNAKRRVAWGITGCGDKLMETLKMMKDIKDAYAGGVAIEVFLSKAGEQVAKYYRIMEELEGRFSRVWVERDANSPFLAGRLQLGDFEFLLIAPATSNTVSKTAYGITDTMLTNAAIQAIKAMVPVYIMPTDYREGTMVTKLPDGSDLKLRVRMEDAENVRTLVAMDGIFPFERPEEILGIFTKNFRHTEAS